MRLRQIAHVRPDGDGLAGTAATLGPLYDKIVIRLGTGPLAKFSSGETLRFTIDCVTFGNESETSPCTG